MTMTPEADSAEKPVDPGLSPPKEETRPVDSAVGPTAELGAPPSHIGKYRIDGVLGQGGMGVVYLAHDPLIDREVAIKLLPPHVSRDRVALQRFQQEARAVGKLNHPNTVAIYELNEDASGTYLVLELVRGESMADLIARQGPFPWREATRFIADICKGLAAAHQAGLIHRDIKPANLMRTKSGGAKILDFGIAKLTDNQTPALTDPSHCIGTPHFMSPEQCQAKPLDARSDIYSLGATYFALLTGKGPFENINSVVQVLYAHVSTPVPNVAELAPGIPPACAKIIERAMAKEPDDRYPDAKSMLADLEAVLDDPTFRVRGWRKLGTRRQFLGAGAALSGAALGGGWWLWPRIRFSGLESGASAIPTPTGPPIRVGILHSISGSLSSSGRPVGEATALAIEEINQAGGLLGSPIKAIQKDAESNGDIAALRADELIREQEVVAIFGPWTSVARKTLLPNLEADGGLLVYPLEFEGLELSPNVIYTGLAPNQQIIPAIRYAYTTLEKRRFFLVGSDYVFPRAANEIARPVIEGLQAKVVGEEYLPLGELNTEPLVKKILKANPDVILNTINGDTNRSFFRALKSAGNNADERPVFSTSVDEQEIRNIGPADAVGHYCVWSFFQSLPGSASQSFVRRFRDRYGSERVVTDPMESGYIGVKLWAQAVEAAGTTDPVAVRRAMLGSSIDAPEGPVSVDPSSGYCSKVVRFGKILPDGQFEILNGYESPIKPVPFPPSKTRAEWDKFLRGLFEGWGRRWAAPVPKISG